MLQRWHRVRVGARWLVLGVALFAAYVLFMVPAHRGSYVIVAKGTDAAGQDWGVSAGSQDTRYFGVALHQSAAATWLPERVGSASGRPLVKLAVPLTARDWSTGAPALNGRFVPPRARDTYMLADVEDAAVSAAQAAPSLSASVERYLWPGVLLRSVVPAAGFLFAAAVMFLLVSLVPHDKSKCAHCNYPLVARRDGVHGRLCPECGKIESQA